MTEKLEDFQFTLEICRRSLPAHSHSIHRERLDEIERWLKAEFHRRLITMFNKFPITEKMHIHSLNGELREATILKRLGDNDYLAEYNNILCHAIYNHFVNKFYVDDKYGVIKNKAASRNEPRHDR